MLFSHKVLRVQYTTYDMRRAQASLNPRSHADFMALAPSSPDTRDSDHPFVYGRLIGIFHAYVKYLGPGASTSHGDYRQVDFIWVRWFQRDNSFEGGLDAQRLHRFQFVRSSSPGAFEFFDPADVLRDAHMIPAFAYGRTSSLLSYSQSMARQTRELDEGNKEWRYHFLNMYVRQ